MYEVDEYNTFDRLSVKFKDVDGETALTSKEMFVTSYELVTMDNIREGEWVECIGIHFFFDEEFVVGEKYKIVQNADGFSVKGTLKTHPYTHSSNGKRYFKPCIPPKEDTMSEKTYSNAEIMQMMDDGKFIDGDEIILVPTIENPDYNAHYGNGAFRRFGFEFVMEKGDKWTIKMVSRWQEIPNEKAPQLLKTEEWKNIRCTLDGECRTLEEWMKKFSQNGVTAMVNLLNDGEWERKL